MLRGFKELLVWQKAYAVCAGVYRATRAFPTDEKYGLTGQLRRAAVSVPSNIAEGYGRGTRAEYLRGARVAYGSNCELETQLLIARDLGYLDKAGAEALQREVREVELMLKALVKSLARPPRSLEPSVSRSLDER